MVQPARPEEETRSTQSRRFPQEPLTAFQDPDDEGNDDGDSDSEVEILLTILPPSPSPRTLPRRATVTPSSSSSPSCPLWERSASDPSEKDESSWSSKRHSPEIKGSLKAVDEDDDDHKHDWQQQDPSSCEETAAPKNNNNITCSSSPVAASRPSRNRVRVRYSAYLQSLAEISHAMLWDLRWRVPSSSSTTKTTTTTTTTTRLWAWERGDDLSAVQALAQRYVIPPRQARFKTKSSGECACFLCQIENGTVHTKRSDAEDLHEQLPDTMSTLDEFVAKHEDTNDPEDEHHDIDDDDDHDDEVYDRALNMYARLYFRKGPWFRIDDIFKYYVPVREQATPASPNSAGSPPGRKNDTKSQSSSHPPSPSKFFLPKSATSKKKQKTKIATNRQHPQIDQEYIQNEVCQAIETCIQDLKQLLGMGLLRSFHSEQECAQQVGQPSKHGLLKQDEQRMVLHKLGGSVNKKMMPTTKQQDKCPRRATAMGENLIWKQMCQQSSIFAKNTDDSTILLPVSKHVDQAIIASWATNIVLRASRVDYLPQGVLKQAVAPIQEFIMELLQEMDVLVGEGLSQTCFCLREAPLKTLRRCCRLYLCATIGPGEMRGDNGTNGWKNLLEEIQTSEAAEGQRSTISHLYPTRTVAPPSSPTWHHTVYPGKDVRFKLTACMFESAYRSYSLHPDFNHEELPMLSPEGIRQVQVFPCLKEFELWEFCVVIRSTADYLVEANDLFLYNERKRARAQEGDCHSIDEVPANDSKGRPSLDFLNVLKKEGRKRILNKFFLGIDSNNVSRRKLEDQVEACVQVLLVGEDSTGECAMKNAFEEILGVFGILAMHLLEFRHIQASKSTIQRMLCRPWLRHLWWDTVLAYVLWDIIPIFERRGFYPLAIQGLEVLLFGTHQQLDLVNVSSVSLPNSRYDATLSRAFLSRRSRGKAFERLIIDYMHILRQKKSLNPPKPSTKKRKRQTLASAPEEQPRPNQIIKRLCEELIASYAPKGQITFSATRGLAKRLKQPLATTLKKFALYEVQELGHRLVPQNAASSTGKYIDWEPVTDYAVATSMIKEGKPSVGGRCSFIGFEDQEDSTVYFGSLNVEELALEYYHTGRLPEEDPKQGVRGGWVGWHDEGGRLRSLFRIVASAFALGTDWGCTKHERKDTGTIHLTPYHDAPLDLHVGAEFIETSQGFYQWRRPAIERLLNLLEVMDPSDISELIYQSIQARLCHRKRTKTADPTLERDLEQTRTLCALANGFGGKFLAAMFRCLFFDYRHYSGGLPDLTLFRAILERGSTAIGSPLQEEELVDLGAWLGEGFSPKQQAERNAQRAASMLDDQDDEFLGCSKVGESGSRFKRNSRRNPARPTRTHPGTSASSIPLPERLIFQHQGRRVRVECMLVEVKSKNDRLDPRQEDWLNVLHPHGNVRVCKFHDGKKLRDALETIDL